MIVVIVGLGYKAVNLVFEARTSSRFMLKGANQIDLTNGEVSNSDNVDINNNSFIERMLSINKYKEYLGSLLSSARSKREPRDVIQKQMIFGSTTLFAILALYYTSHINVFLYLAVPVALLTAWIPIRNLKKARQYYIYQMKIQLPDYLSHFAVLLKSYNPYEATQRSVDYAGPLLRKNVEKLITQISLYPSSPRPYIEFAEEVGVREARDFMIALQQIMRVDAESADRVIENQIQILDELQEEAYQDQIETRPEEVERYVSPMLYPFVAVIFVMVGVLMLHTFSTSF